jgi:transcriptional regulator with XRE-family HTH domain
MLRAMTQTVGVLLEHGETLSQRAARRLRGALAENRISQTELARVLHMPQQKISRKVNGQTPLMVDEIELIAQALNVSLEAVLGIGDFAERPIGLCAIRDSNPEPADSMPRRRHLVLVSAEGVAPVLPLRRAGETAVRLVVLGGAA